MCVDRRGVEGFDQLEHLYEACYRRLVGLLALAGGSRAEAEDCVQEAFIRLIKVWSKVSRYEDPEAWLRCVAFRQLSNRRRAARTAARGLLRLGSPPEQASPSEDSLDIARALATLPLGQRQVVVLHYYVQLELTAIARELNVPLGTVKSRLSRARTSLAPILEPESSHA